MRQASFRVALVLPAVVLFGGCEFLSDPPRGPVANDLIEEVYVIDAEGVTCLNCPDGVIPKEVREILESVHLAATGRWIQSHFTFRYDDFNPRMKNADPARLRFFFRMGESQGVFYQGDRFRIHYEGIPCWFWDCYKPRMWRIDEGGRQRWRRRVPFARAPVVPFVVGEYILYIGGSVDGDMLVIVDLDTGRVVGHFLPEGEEEGFSESALLSDPPFYRDGFIYLRGHEKTRLDRVKKESKVIEPAKRYVLKVNF